MYATTVTDIDRTFQVRRVLQEQQERQASLVQWDMQEVWVGPGRLDFRDSQEHLDHQEEQF